MSPEPIEIRAPRGASWLEVEWTAGGVSRLPHRLLRGLCPCATCQGHQGPIEWTEPPDTTSTQLADLEEVGNYALRLTWADGHNTGIYAFAYLRSLERYRNVDESTWSSIKVGR